MKIHLIQMKIDELLAVCDEHNNDPGELINILHAAQGIFGYLPREVQEIIAGRLHIPVSKCIWSCDVLFVLYHDSEGEISYFRLSGNGLLCTWSRESLGRVPAPSWRSKLERLHPTACFHWIVYVVWGLADWLRSSRLPEKFMDV